MKRLSAIFALSLMLLSPVFAQTVNQKGIVKDISYSLEKEGEPIPDVKLKVMVETSSNDNGEFSIPVPLNSNRVFTFENIRKDGYELISPNKEQLSQTEFAVNSSAKVLIVMASKSKLYQERRRIENDIRQAYSREMERMSGLIDDLSAERDSLEQLSQDISAIAEEIQGLKNELDEYRENYYDADLDILERATALSRIDYQTISEADAQIYELMKQGKGVEAANASRERLSPEVWKMVKSNPLCLRNKRDMAQKMLDDARKIALATSDGFRMAFRHDSSAFYLKLYADMDPSDLSGQLEYADYIFNELNRFDEASEYITRVLESTDSLSKESILAKSYQGSILSAKGYTDEAEKAYRQALCWSRQMNLDELLWTTLNNLGSFYCAGDKFLEAEGPLLEALKLKEKSGADNSSICNAYIELADLYTRKNNLDKAFEYLSKCPQPEDESTKIQLYSIKANYYSTIADYDESIRYELLAEEKAREYYGPVHRSVATIYANIALSYRIIGQYKRAEEYLKMALSIVEQLVGKDNIRYYEKLSVLCQVLTLTGRYEEALEYYEEITGGLSGNSFAKGLLTHTYTDMASAYQGMNEPEKTEEYLQKALAMSLEVFGEFNKATTTIYNNFGFLYAGEKKYDLALEYFNKALKNEIAIFGPDSAELISCYCNIGLTNIENNNTDVGIKMYREAIRIGELNDSNPLKLSYIYNNLATALYNRAQYESALEYGKKALELREMTDDYLLTVETITNLAQIYERMSDWEKAIETFEYVIEYSKKHIGKDDTKELAYAYYKTGVIHFMLENYDDCLKNAEEAYRIYSQLFGEENKATQASKTLIQSSNAEQNPHIYLAEVVEGYAASKKGFSGTYIILSVNDKNILSGSNLMSYLQTLPKETPKEIYLMDFDYNISKLELEKGGIGAYLEVKIVSKSLLNRIIKEYKTYLKNPSL